MVWQAKLGLPNHPRILMWSENIIASQIPVWSSKLEAGEIVIHTNLSTKSDLGSHRLARSLQACNFYIVLGSNRDFGTVS